MKPDLTEIKNAAYGRWPEIHAALGIPAKLLNTRKHQPCPHCGGKDRFRYTDHKHGGGYICNQCTPEGGSGFDLLMLVFGYSFTEAVNQVSALLGLSDGLHGQYAPMPAQPEQPPADRQAALLAAWGEALPLDGKDPASLYLQGRGLSLPETLPEALRFAPSLPYWLSDGRSPALLGHYPAMLAAIERNGELQGLHITYLQQKGGVWRKLTASHPDTGEALPAKKMKARYAGALNGAAVHLGTPDGQGRLLAAEGIETALAASSLFDLPAAACLSAHGLSAFDWPPETRELYIAADNDLSRTGIKAAEALARRSHAAGLTVKIWQPDKAGTDALDEWNARRLKTEGAAQ
ncbi:hypothetical protein HMPREF3107_00285 [Neisseria sp. HMSC31F04]|uniref:DUF7146 domain-containing protein n=1 Tax=Neisseria sp. HMSC31F04 TaxID=1581075 RepID=UPI0008A2CAE4|nr:toprim domain-containing protein [Neisseria sp. HMSC31F04]OFT04464.1 hypothetical protein HMPREF3107_00285 [Neisseria sp. HMSC31F04]